LLALLIVSTSGVVAKAHPVWGFALMSGRMRGVADVVGV